MNVTMLEIKQTLASYGLNVLGAIATVVIGLFVAKLVRKLMKKVLEARKVDETLSGFVCSLTYGAVVALVIVSALERLGLETASAVAVLGAVGLAVGLALQGTLASFASGVLLILFKPFRVGDFIEGGGTSGIVEEIGIFNTEMRTGDNKKIIVPNANLTGDNIVNYSAKDTRRIDLVVGVSYDDDLDKVRKVLEQILADDERILDDPEPTIGVLELADSSVNFVFRPWVKASDWWPTMLALQEQIKKRFDAEGISIPFPQRDVHLIQSKEGAA